jgi:hypothetical protein
MSQFPKPNLEQIMRWLHANGSPHQASEIIDGTFQIEPGTISYEIFVPPSGRHRVYIPQSISYQQANSEQP